MSNQLSCGTGGHAWMRHRHWLPIWIALVMLLACTRAPASPAPKEAAPEAVGPAGAPASLSEADRRKAADFYRGKTFKIVVGYAAGGGYDTYSRLLARHLRQYIPGNPTVIVENRPGAGGLVAANYVANVAPKDGTEMAHVDPYLILGERAGRPGIEFKSTEINWIGNPTPDEQACVVRADRGFDSVESIRQSGRQANMGATGIGGVVYAVPAAINETFAPVFNILPGYGGTSQIRLAVDSGELDGACWGWSSVRVTGAAWFEGSRPFVNVVAQTGASRQPDLPNVPTLRELVRDRDKLFIIDVIDALARIDRVYLMPGGVPPERVAAMREAFMKAWTDPQLLAEAERTQLEVKANNYQVIDEAVRTIMSLSDDRVQLLTSVLGIE